MTVFEIAIEVEAVGPHFRGVIKCGSMRQVLVPAVTAQEALKAALDYAVQESSKGEGSRFPIRAWNARTSWLAARLHEVTEMIRDDERDAQR